METLQRSRKLAKDSLPATPPVAPDTDGDSMRPESRRSSGSALDGLCVDSDHIGVDPDASSATVDMFSG